MGDICRTCLRTQDYLLDLYENRELIFKIESIVSIEIQEEPFFPSKICYECVGNITNSFNFNKVLINSFNELNKRYEIHQKTKAGEEECNENIKVEPVDFKQENAILDHTDIIKDEADNTEIEHKEIKSTEPIKCNVCLKTFKKLESLRYHRQRHSGKIFTCELCGQCFNVKRSYIKHVKTHAVVYKTPILEMNREVEKENKANIIKIEPILQPNYIISSEDPIDNSINGLNEQYQIKAEEKGVKEESKANIKVEPDDTLSSENFKNENTAILDAGVIKVEPDDFLSDGDLKQENDALLDDIDYSFNERKTVKVEPILMPDYTAYKKKKLFDCNECQKTFTSKHKYQTHIREHTSKGACNICGMVLRSDNLKRHIRLHSEEPIECNICSKILKNSESLRIHKRIHLGIKFKCDICGKCFKVKTEHSRHVKTHTDPEILKYKCKVSRALKINIRERFSNFFDAGDPKKSERL
ncbi:unnamed protein product [Brassicogethes aeneus]|uniref:Uncharacterized protein n=1 Tax=Brassicogethes aeneus TaxID=1431903 RepID=A0A9P0FK10_BRAAE|nr:unnamed protein product [Brassicogethes aeneus]